MAWNILSQLNHRNKQDKVFGPPQSIGSSWAEIQQIISQFAVAIIVGFIFNRLQIPVGWLLGPMIVGILFAVFQQTPQTLPPFFMTIGKAFLGLATAVRFSPETLMIATTYALPLLLCVLITASLSLFYGYLLSRWSGIDRTTGILSFVPGMASTIVAIGEEIGADAVAIALLQYVRLLLVIIIIPGLASVVLPHSSMVVPPDSISLPINSNPLVFGNLTIVLHLSLLALCCIIGLWAGKLLRLPASGYLGPFIAGLLLFWLSPDPIDVPQWIFTTGLLLVGLSIGVKFDWQSVRHLWKAVVIEVGLVILLSLLCLGVGYEFHVITHVDTSTAVLGFTPGGLEAMIATVIQLGGNSGLVLAMQLTRMLLIILIGPWLIKRFISPLDTQEEAMK